MLVQLSTLILLALASTVWLGFASTAAEVAKQNEQAEPEVENPPSPLHRSMASAEGRHLASFAGFLKLEPREADEPRSYLALELKSLVGGPDSELVSLDLGNATMRLQSGPKQSGARMEVLDAWLSFEHPKAGPSECRMNLMGVGAPLGRHYACNLLRYYACWRPADGRVLATLYARRLELELGRPQFSEPRFLTPALDC